MKRAGVPLFILLLLVPGNPSEGPTIPSEGPIILVYSGSMPGWGSALCEILNGDPRADYRCVAIQERDTFSLLLFLPRTQGIILASSVAADVKGLSAMVEDFMIQGGAVIGFSACVDVRNELEMASRVFPFFANRTMGSERVDNVPMNAYVVRDANSRINEDMPQSFRLIGELLLLSAGPGDEVLNIVPEEGEAMVFYEEAQTRAPLVIGYQRPGSGRSVGFAGCRVNEVQRLASFYGNLAAQEEFVQLIRNAVLWATEGSPRYTHLGPSWRLMLEAEAGRREEAVLRAAEVQSRRNMRRMLILVSLWTGAILVCAIVIKGCALSRISGTTKPNWHGRRDVA